MCFGKMDVLKSKESIQSLDNINASNKSDDSSTIPYQTFQHKEIIKTGVNKLINVGVLKRTDNSKWVAPTFIISKKNGTVCFLSDFRELNKPIKRKPFPVPKIQDLLLKLEAFKCTTSLDLYMGYYHIKLFPFSRKLCTIVLPWGKYKYQKVPIGLCPNKFFQDKKTNCSMMYNMLEQILMIS